MEKKENKTMKKGLTIAALALLLGIVGYTGGNTFAKYVTSATPVSESATVAQWGYTVTANATNLFSSSYVKEGANVVASANHDTAGVVVSANSNEQVVAPGTSGSMLININGAAEVKSKIVVAANSNEQIELTAPVAYRPIQWTLTVDSNKVGGSAVAELVTTKTDDFEEIVTLLEKVGKAEIAANAETDIKLELSWEWAFEKGAKPDEKALNNKYDTMLGDLAVLNNTQLEAKYGVGAAPAGNTSFDFSLTIDIEQIQ